MCNLNLGIFHRGSWPVAFLNVCQLEFHEETTPQSLSVLESSTTFDRQKFHHICASRKLFHYSKTLQIRKKQVFMQESGYHSGPISKDKDHKNLSVSSFLPQTTNYPGKTCNFLGKEAITWSFKMALVILVRLNRGILRCLFSNTLRNVLRAASPF